MLNYSSRILVRRVRSLLVACVLLAAALPAHAQRRGPQIQAAWRAVGAVFNTNAAFEKARESFAAATDQLDTKVRNSTLSAKDKKKLVDKLAAAADKEALAEED